MPSPKKKAEESGGGAIVGVGCLALFAMPFACGALFMAWKLGAMLWLAVEVQSWEPTPATLESVQLKTHSGDSETYEVLATYRYEFNGQQFTGDRVGLSTDADNFEKYHKQLHARLDDAKQAGVAVDCFVDPDDPSRSLLDRTLRPVVLAFFVPFVFGFGAVGFGLLWGAWYAGRAIKRENALKAADPETPWLWRDDWRAGVVRSSNRAGMITVGFFALLWNSISLPLVPICFSAGDGNLEWWKVLLVLIFPAIGVGLLVWFGYRFLRWRRYGESSFRMAGVPGVIGGQLAGVVVAPNEIATSEEIRAVLACIRTVQSGDNNREDTVWQDERVIERTLSADDPGRVGVPIVFTIPSNSPETSSEHQVEWRLTVKAKTPGIDYEADFQVPVFRTEDSCENVDVGAETLSQFEQDRPLEQLLAEEGIKLEQLDSLNGVRFVSPPARTKGAAAGITCFTLVWTTVVVVLFYNGILLIGSVFAAFDALMVLATLDSWLGCSDLKITSGQWECRNGWYGFRGRGKKFISEHIQSIEAQHSMSSGEGTDRALWNNVVAYLERDQRVTLVRQVRGREAERKLMAELRRHAGLKAATDAWNDVEAASAGE